VRVLKGHKPGKPIRSLAFSPDGTMLATSALDYKTFLWDLATGQHAVVETTDSYTVTFSPGGRTVATGRGSDLTLWDARTRESRRHVIQLHPDYDHWGTGWDLAYSPDGRLLAAASHTLRVYDSATLAEIPLLAVLGPDPTVHPTWPGTPAFRFATNSLAFTSDGTTLASGHHGPKHVVRLWDTKTWLVRKELTGSTAKISTLSFSPDGRYLAASASTALLVWDVPSGELVVRQAVNKRLCKGVYSPDGRLVGLARNDASIRFLSAGGWHEVAAYDFEIGPMLCLAIAPDGMRVAGGSGKGQIVVFDVDL
jgi:WD40 repeat protein